MKKQFKRQDWTFGKSIVYVYHDGELVDSKNLWNDECEAEIDKLEENGYTYGYTKDEVEAAKRRYERMLKNIIED